MNFGKQSRKSQVSQWLELNALLWRSQVQSLVGELKFLKRQSMDQKIPDLYTVQMYEVNIFLFSFFFSLYTFYKIIIAIAMLLCFLTLYTQNSEKYHLPFFVHSQNDLAQPMSSNISTQYHISCNFSMTVHSVSKHLSDIDI